MFISSELYIFKDILMEDIKQKYERALAYVKALPTSGGSIYIFI